MHYLDDVNGKGLASFAFELELNQQMCSGTSMPGEQCDYHTFCCCMQDDADVQLAASPSVCNEIHAFSSRNHAVANDSASPAYSSASDLSMAPRATIDDEYSHAWASIRSETSETQPLAEWMEQHFLSSGSFRSQSPIMQLK